MKIINHMEERKVLMEDIQVGEVIYFENDYYLCIYTNTLANGDTINVVCLTDGEVAWLDSDELVIHKPAELHLN